MNTKEIEHFWNTMALGHSDAGVIDPADKRNHKNNYICYVRNHYFCRELDVPSKDTLVLDFGCGTGLVTVALSDKGYYMIGVDISENLLTYAKATRPNLNLFKIDGKSLPFENDSVSSIVVYVVFNYFKDDMVLADMLSEMSRVLRPGGKIIAIEQTSKRRTVIDKEYKTLRTREDYCSLFESGKLCVQEHKTIRFGRFPTTYLIRYGCIPRSFWKIIRIFEAMVGKCYPASDYTYTDTLFVAVKKTR